MPSPPTARVLLVDDDKDTLIATTIGLSKHGFQADGVASSAGALAKLRDEKGKRMDSVAGGGEEKTAKYDLIILDIKMPGMDGFSLYNEIRKMGVDSKVCFMTALDPESYNEDRKRLLEELPDKCFIQKPITLFTLVATINSVLGLSALPSSRR